MGLGWVLGLLCAEPDLLLRRLDPCPLASNDRHVFDPASPDEFTPLAHYGGVDLPSLFAAVRGSDLVLRLKRVEHLAVVGLHDLSDDVVSDPLLPPGSPILHLGVEAVQELSRPDLVPQEQHIQEDEGPG